MGRDNAVRTTRRSFLATLASLVGLSRLDKPKTPPTGGLFNPHIDVARLFTRGKIGETIHVRKPLRFIGRSNADYDAAFERALQRFKNDRLLPVSRIEENLKIQGLFNRSLSAELELRQVSIQRRYRSLFYKPFYDPHLDPRRLPA